MRPTRVTWALSIFLSLFSLAMTVNGADDGPPASEIILFKKCAITYERATVVGAFSLHGTAGAQIQEILVKQGDRVKAGQVLGRLFNKDVVAELQTHVAELDQSKITVIQKEVLYSLEQAKFERLRKINARQALLVSAQDMQIQSIMMQVAKLDVSAAIQGRRHQEATVQQFEAIVKSRDLVSPHEGLVVEIFAPVGETVMTARPIFRVVDVDQLRVTAYLDARDVWRVKKGQPVQIMPDISGGDLPLEKEVFHGEVTFVDSEIDPENHVCRVIALVQNRDSLLRAGMECRMEIDLRNRVQGKPIAPKSAHGAVLPDRIIPTAKVHDPRSGR